MFTSLLLVFAIFCVYFGLPFDPCFFGGYHIYIYICARRLHDLFVHFGRNAVRMRSMHSECIPAQYQDQDPRFAQKSCGKSWKYQDPRSKIPTRLLAKILEIPRSKIQDGRNAFSGILWAGIILRNYQLQYLPVSAKGSKNSSYFLRPGPWRCTFRAQCSGPTGRRGSNQKLNAT